MAASICARDPWIAPGREPTHEDGKPFLETYEAPRRVRRRASRPLETYEQDTGRASFDGSDRAGYCGVGPDRLPGDAKDELF